MEEFRQVGELINLSQRKVIRSMKNPMDRCTIVSILNKAVNEVKHTIEPGKFNIAPGTYDKPSTLIVGPSSWWREIDLEQPMLEIPVSSIQIADSVIKDYCNGILGCNMSDRMPGLFFVMGEISVAKIKTDYQAKLKETKVKQDNWFQALVKLGDSLWARSNGNPLAISDEMRLAANELNLKDKVWLKDFQTIEKVPCKGCGNLNNPLYPVCPVCKAINSDSPGAKDLKFAVG